MKNESKLTNKQERFCEEYIIDLNATQAAIRAGYSKKTANEQSSRLLVNVNVREYISQLRKDLQERNQISVDECISILASIARFDIADLFTEEGVLKPITELPKEARLAILSLDIEQYRDSNEKTLEVKKIRTINKEGVIDKLLKHLGGYEKNNNQKQVKFNLSNFSDELIKELINASQ